MGGAGGFSRSSSNASASGTGRQRAGMLRTHSTTASDAALVAQLQVRAQPPYLHSGDHVPDRIAFMFCIAAELIS